jgi:hypothetical protein
MANDVPFDSDYKATDFDQKISHVALNEKIILKTAIIDSVGELWYLFNDGTIAYSTSNMRQEVLVFQNPDDPVTTNESLIKES